MADYPIRLVLSNVPKVNFHDGGARCPEDIPDPSVMRALMEYLEPEDFGCRCCRALQPRCRIDCGYAFFIGVSGWASYLDWGPGWGGDNCATFYMSDDPAAPYSRMQAATGYEFKTYGACTGQSPDREELRTAIVASISSGRPVLAFGPIGPPESTLITGYDENGDVLIGWSFFQGFPAFSAGLEFEPTGEFRARDWFDYPPGFTCITVGQKKEAPKLRQTYRGALEWMIQVARTPVTYGNRANGLAAYDAWSERLNSEEDFPDDEAVLRQRHEVHNVVVGCVAEARWYGSRFLASIAGDVDEFIHREASEDIFQAAGLYAGMHALMWKLWDLAGGIGNPNAWQLFADASVRRQMLPIIVSAKETDARAIEHIERALAYG